MMNTNERLIRCVTRPDFYTFPGQKCNDVEFCSGGRIVDGFCRGKTVGEECYSAIECDIGLRCSASKLVCEPAGEEGEYCNDSNMTLCQSYLVCHNSKCTRYGSMPNGHAPGAAGADLCESHYVNADGLCDEGPLLKGDIFVSSPGMICQYSNGETSRSVCGYHFQGNAICKPGAGTMMDTWKELLEYLKRRPQCHPHLSHMGQCDIAVKIGKALYRKGRVAYGVLYYFASVQKVPYCVQQFVHKDYFEILNGTILTES